MRPRSQQQPIRRAVILVVALSVAFATLVVGPAESEQQNVAERVHALRHEADSIAAQQRYAAAIPLIDELIRLEQAQPFPAQRDLGKDLVSIASVLMPSERYQPLEYLFNRGIQLLQSSANVQIGDIAVALNNLSVLYDRMGAYKARDQTTSALVAMAANLQSPIDADAAEVFLQLGDTYANAHQFRPAAILYKRLHGYMLERYQGTPELLAAWMKTYADVLAGNSQFREAVTLYGKGVAMLDDSATTNTAFSASVLLAMGRAARLDGDLSKAEVALERATLAAKEAALDETLAGGMIDHSLATVYLLQRRREKYPDAVALFRHALDILARAGKASTADFAQNLYGLARALDLDEKAEKAELSYGEAINVFEGLSIPAPLQLAECLSDFADLLIRQQRAADATKNLRRALALRESIPGQTPQQIANALSDLAMAEFKEGKLEEASREYWRAITTRQASTAAPH